MPTNPQRDCQFVSYRECDVLKEPALAPSHPDFTPRNKQWWVHEPKERNNGQIQTLLTDSNRQHVFVVHPPSHLCPLHTPFHSVERHSLPIDLRQREPATN